MRKAPTRQSLTEKPLKRHRRSWSRQREVLRQEITEAISFSSIIKCGICGENFKRVTCNGRVYWNCRTFQEREKGCTAKQIPEGILEPVTAEVLGLETLTERFSKNRSTISKFRVLTGWSSFSRTVTLKNEHGKTAHAPSPDTGDA